ncbi:MAG: aminoacyl-tRNA hydrolase [Flavobacteriales bacterium]|nr:MAG: aminoacyl-tRNA hydrolase [Flavobacteriales bacterium]
MNIREIDFEPELTFKTTRSSGKGGQHVNKVETRVELYFDVRNSQLISDEQKERIAEKLKNRISNEGILFLSSEKSRSQIANKKDAVERFYQLLEKALKKEKPRIATKPSKGAKEKRLKEKKMHTKKKEMRKKPDWEK